MVRLIEKGAPGTDFPILIDGRQVSILPADLDQPPTPVSDYLDRFDGGASEHQRRPFFLGAPNYKDRYSFTFTYDTLSTEDRIVMEELRVMGGIHRLTVWRMVPVIWSCLAGVARYYLPSLRKPAAHLYDALVITGRTGVATVTTEAFPIDAWLNDDPLTVTYAEGPTLADPGAGGIVIARQPDASGEAADYVAVRIGDTVVTGDILKLWGCWTHEVSLRAPGVTLRGQAETQNYTFVEV